MIAEVKEKTGLLASYCQIVEQSGYWAESITCGT